MRVPIPVVILLILTVISGVWFGGTRHVDFMTPPSEAKLQEIRTRVELSFPQGNQVAEPTPEPPPPPEPEKPVVVEPPKPEIDPGDLSAAPALTHYGDRVALGPAHLTELATFLETKGQFQRALLAWERVIDLSKPDTAQKTAAIAAIKRLRPTLPDWNTDPAKVIPVTIHAGTGSKMAKTLAPELEKAARSIERASSGMIKIKTDITPARGNVKAKGPTPIALWMTGAGKKTSSTEVLSFTVDSTETLQQDILKSVFQLVSGSISQSTSYTPPDVLGPDEKLEDALNFRITRLCWNEVGTLLNLPPKKEAPAVKKP